MPPGPRGIPLLGNVFQMPTELPWIRFFEFSKKYGVHLQPELNLPFSHDLIGPVVSFNAAGHPVIVLNDHKSAYELLGKIQMIKS